MYQKTSSNSAIQFFLYMPHLHIIPQDEDDDDEDEDISEEVSRGTPLKLGKEAEEELNVIQRLIAQEALVYGSATAVKKVCAFCTNFIDVSIVPIAKVSQLRKFGHL